MARYGEGERLVCQNEVSGWLYDCSEMAMASTSTCRVDGDGVGIDFLE